jgi:hypothetical protein
MTSGVPVLEELVGTPWPGGLTTVREDRSVNVRGYDGWFDSSEDAIAIGEQLDQELLYHELLHAWASPNSFEERWLYEGIAQYLAARAVATQGDKPARLRPASAASKQAVPLNTWGDVGGRAQPTDGYGYPASYRAMKALLDGMDEDTRSRVMAAAIAGQSAYAVSSGEAYMTASRTGWRRFLDLVEVLGHNNRGPRIFSTWVLTPRERKLLNDRRRALANCRDVDAADGQWVPPLGVRAAMTDWDFEQAQLALTQVADLGPAAIEVQEAAQRHDIEVPDAVVALYQGAYGATAYDELSDTLPRAASAVDAVGAADAAAESSNPVEALGGLVLDVDDKAAEAYDLLAEGDLDGATSAAEEASDAAERSTLVGAGVLAGGLVLLVGSTLLGRALLRRRARRRNARADAAPVAPAAAGGTQPDPVDAARDETSDAMNDGSQ